MKPLKKNIDFSHMAMQCLSSKNMKNTIAKVAHEFGPFYDENSKILILGSIPSPKSREQGFYYGHPRNRFWPVLSKVLEEPVPETLEEKKELLRRYGIALWDVLAGCEIRGADDSSIINPEANDMRLILNQVDIKAVFTTGTKAYKLYEKMCFPVCGVAAINLPSTSPANAAWSLDRLTVEYQQILKYL